MKTAAPVQSLIGLHDHDFTINMESNNAVIKSGTKLPKQLQDEFAKKVKMILPNVIVSFSE